MEELFAHEILVRLPHFDCFLDSEFLFDHDDVIKGSNEFDRGILVSIFCRVIFRRDDQTATLSCAAIDGFYIINHDDVINLKNLTNNVDKLLLVLNGPVDFVVVTRTQIDHNVLVSKEKLFKDFRNL